jgi:hypothetical protein
MLCTVNAHFGRQLLGASIFGSPKKLATNDFWVQLYGIVDYFIDA